MLDQSLSAPTTATFGYYDPLGKPCSAASRNGQTYAGCPARSAQAPDISNSLPGFPVYSMSQSVNGVTYTLYAWTVGSPGSYEGVIGFAPGTAATYANYAGVAMNLYASSISGSSPAPYVTYASSWTKNPSNPNAVAYTLSWAALNPPPKSPPPPPLPPAPPPDAPDPYVVEDVEENTWAVWTSITLLSLGSFVLVITTIVCCMKNAKIEETENKIDKGEATQVAADDSDDDADEKQIKSAARKIQRKASAKRGYMPPPPTPPNAFIVVQ